MSRLILILLSFLIPVASYAQLTGYVLDAESGYPVAGVSINLHKGEQLTQSDNKGYFAFKAISFPDSITVKHVGYKSQSLVLTINQNDLFIYLDPIGEAIEEVIVSTGYYRIPLERSSGSFEVINGNTLNQSFSGSLLDRLEGNTSSIAFDRRRSTLTETPNDRLSLRLRGISTVKSNSQPLIIVNDFPYEGDFNDINPNDIEQITLLKDAVASSLWGARSGNGVIVIKLKEGVENTRQSISAHLYNRIGSKPDLMSSWRHIPSNDYIELEKQMFSNNYYRDHPVVVRSPVVDLLFKHRAGEISENELEDQLEVYRGRDIRKEASEILYRTSNEIDAGFSSRGGTANFGYVLSLGYNNNNEVISGNQGERYSLRSDSRISLSDRITFELTTDFIHRNRKANGISLFDVGGLIPASKNMLYPYASLDDKIAKAYSHSYLDQFNEDIGRDWYLYPLQEIQLRDNRFNSNAIRGNAGLVYKVLDGLQMSMKYNYNLTLNSDQINHHRNSFFTRNLVNQFTQADGKLIIPEGGIQQWNRSRSERKGGRIQLDYDRRIFDGLNVTGLAGAEISQQLTIYDPSQVLYGFDSDTYLGNASLDYENIHPTRPQGSQRIPGNGGQVHEYIDRFVSYFALGSLEWARKYILTSSLRWDASNLFGVKTNNKGVPLWSTGLSWNVSNEKFMEKSPFVLLKVRTSYGVNGNINKDATAYPTAFFARSSITQLQEAGLRTAGNPQLRWEKVKTFNAGLDFAIVNNRLRGVFDYYTKNSFDLIGYSNLDPTTGILPGNVGVIELTNYGKLWSRGIDMSLSSMILQTKAFQWETGLTTSFVKNKVVDYQEDVLNINQYFQPNVAAVAGKSRDIMYAFPWYGLDSKTGSPLVMNDNGLGIVYGTNVTAFPYENLLQVGNSFPLWSGGFSNRFNYKSVTLHALIMWKGKYNFRRPSINYASLLENWQMHEDYTLRWRQTGDEHLTNVPSQPRVLDRNREIYYANSEILVERGDHIRLQNLSLSYHLPLSNQKIAVEIQCTAENLGLIWRKNNRGLDPEYFQSFYMPPRIYSVGTRIVFN